MDILAAGADPFSVAAADVLMNVFQTNPGDTAVSGYTHHTVNLTTFLNAHVGAPLTLRFAETDNVLTFQLGVDNVDIDVGAAAVPEPSSALLAGAALVAIGCLKRRRVGA